MRCKSFASQYCTNINPAAHQSGNHGSASKVKGVPFTPVSPILCTGGQVTQEKEPLSMQVHGKEAKVLLKAFLSLIVPSCHSSGRLVDFTADFSGFCPLHPTSAVIVQALYYHLTVYTPVTAG